MLTKQSVPTEGHNLPCHKVLTHVTAVSIWSTIHSLMQQAAIVAQVRNFIDTHQVVCTGPFIYAYVEEVNCPCYSRYLAFILRNTDSCSPQSEFLLKATVCIVVSFFDRRLFCRLLVLTRHCCCSLQGTPSVKYFSKPMTLCKLARFLRESWIISVSRCNI